MAEASTDRCWSLSALVVGVAALAVAAWLLPLRAVPGWLDGLGVLAGPCAVLVGALLLAALVPRTAISIACGALFGPLPGGGYALAAALLAAAGTYAAGRLLGRDPVSGWLSRHPGRTARLDAWLARRGLPAVVLVRMMPLAPYGLIGYLYGTTSVRTRHYLAGTAIGATPSALSYAAVGAAVVNPTGATLLAYAPAALGLLVSAGVAIYWRLSTRDGRGPARWRVRPRVRAGRPR